MLLTGNPLIDAEQAFRRATRARRRAALLGTLRRSPAPALPVLDERDLARSRGTLVRGVHEIPLDAITATLEPARAPQFDREFRPARVARSRWQRVWMAEHLGRPLPPISVVRFDDGYAVRDGHHRVSVARARGAATIDAVEVP
jgi:ParB-like chromosome segregation protein Spo0J